MRNEPLNDDRVFRQSECAPYCDLDRKVAGNCVPLDTAAGERCGRLVLQEAKEQENQRTVRKYWKRWHVEGGCYKSEPLGMKQRPGVIFFVRHLYVWFVVAN